MGQLEKVDLTLRLDREEYDKRLAQLQRRMLQLRLSIGGHLDASAPGPGVLVVMEGPDASGKGGAIKAMVGNLDPRHYNVVSYGAPSRLEKDHHFLWRFYTELPGMGQMAVFDRSWYGRVLVERIEGFCSREAWRRAYKAIVDFEESLCIESLIVVKLYMHLSDEEQLKRFHSRAEDPLKRWKLTPEDWRNREKNRDYEKAAEEMFAKTSHKMAPWDIISGEQKRWARIQALSTVIQRIEEGMKRWGMAIPHPEEAAKTPLDQA